MTLRFRLIVCFVFVSVTPFTVSAPVPKDEPRSGPQVWLRLQSAEELSRRATEFMKAILPPEMFKLANDQLNGLDAKQIPLIDPTKPAGFYASFHPSILKGEFKDSQIVFLIPVKGEKETVEFLEKVGVPIQKGEKVYTIRVGGVPFSLYARFDEGYAHVAIGSDMAIDPSRVISPKTFFAEKETAAATLTIRFDRLPAEIRDLSGPLISLAPQVSQNSLPPGLRDFEKPWNESIVMLARWAKRLSDDGKEMTLRADLNPKVATLDFDITVEGKPNTNLAEAIQSITPLTNRFGSLVTSDTAAYVVTKGPLFVEDLRMAFGEMAKDVGKQLLNDIRRENQEAKDFVETFFDALSKTAKSGNMDVAVVLNGPSKEGAYQAMGAIQLQSARAVEKAFIAQMKTAPNRILRTLTFEASKIGDESVHEIDLSEQLDEVTKKIFGKKPKISYSFTEEGLFVAFGSDNMTALKSALAAKPVRQPLLELKAFPRRFDQLLNDLGVGKNVGVAEMILTKPDSTTAIRIDYEGGEKLKVKLSFGAVVPLMMGTYVLSTRENGGGQPAVKQFKK